MKFDNLHPILQRQFIKSGFSETDLENEQFSSFIEKINRAYSESDQGRYIKERALEISSREMQELYTKINHEKKSLEIALQELIAKDSELIIQRNYAGSLVASISDMLFIADDQMIISDVNQNVASILHVEKKDLTGVSLKQFFANIDPILTLTQNESTQNSFVNYMTEIKIDSSGKTIPSLISASIIIDAENRSNGIICIVKDISELRKLEKENAEKMALLSHAGRLAALGEMATGIAHELNQPLAIIKMNMQTLDFFSKDTPLTSEDTKDIIDTVIQQVDRASRIINHMRAFARKQELIADPIDLRIPIQDALSMFNEQFRLHEIQIIEVYSDDLPQVHIDATQFEQIVVNLLSNAKYSLAAMNKISLENNHYHMQIQIKLYYEKSDDTVIIEIGDNGIGMPPDVVDRCLEPFFTTKKIGEGTGLGLSIVYNYIKELGGEIQVQSAPQKGALFRIIIPLNDSSKKLAAPL